MRSRLLPLSFACLLAFGVATGAHAQSKVPGKHGAQTVLPVYNNTSGKLEAVLLLEPTDDGAKAGARWRFGGNSLDAAFGLEAGDSLALLCRQNGIAGAIGNLANNCMLAALGDDLNDEGSRRTSANAAFSTSGGSKLGISVGNGRDTLPAWLTPGTSAASKVDINDLRVFARRNLPREAFVSIAGTVARARLIPEAEAGNLADRWSSKTLTLGGGFGAFGASIVGHVVDTPGQPKWEGLGLGLTWRTPWSGQLTVGADNLITRGKNPFSPVGETQEDEGTVPYVRYEQDL